jgi:hypothetical protein
MKIYLRFFYAFFVVGLAGLLFYTPAVFSKGILQIDHEDLTQREKVLTKIPLINVAMTERLYTGRVSSVLISTVALIVSFVVRLIAIRYATGLVAIQYITVIFFVVSLIAMLVSNMVIVFMVINDANTKSLSSTLLYAAIFPLGQVYVGYFLSRELKNIMRQEATFK